MKTKHGVMILIAYDNLVYNIERSKLKGTISCDRCGKRVKVESNKGRYCKECSQSVLQEQKNRWKRDNWNKKEEN